ncbi:MAG: AgmX/PglI C-terminal domain-containing protein, partial [Alphaproteobacteria bacterium]|nr:AgmX/PglI C-terminal domain-containing protein [Alphaproteobacteria bacterium]
EAAREVYEQAQEDGRKAALLEQQRENLFTQYVSGICPGERVTVTIEYVEQVDYEDGLYTLAVPTTVGERYSPPWVDDRAELVTPYARTGREVDVTVYIEEGMPVEALWSDSHDIEVLDEDELGAAVGLHPDDRTPNRDFSLTWALSGHQPRAALLTHRAAGQDGYLALTLEPQIVDDLFEPRPRELFFVIDSSCSMNGWPYETARATVLLALEEMGPQDTFNLVRFSGAATALFDTPQPPTAANRKRAREWLARFEGGGTEMDQGIIKALTAPGRRDAMRLVLMMTDGFVGGEEKMFETVRDHLGNARMFSLGVGTSVNRYLLEGLAEMGRGDVTYHLGRTPIEESVQTFYSRIAHPALSDVRVDWGDAEVYDQYPRKIPDLWAGQPLRVVGRYRGEGPTTVRVTGIVGTEPFSVELPVALPEAEPHHGAVAKIWARRKIRDIEWYPRGRTDAEVRAEVIDVALDHHLVSRYTSLVAVDDEPCPCADMALREVQVAHERDAGMSLGQLGTSGYGSGASGYGYGSGIGGIIGAKGRQISAGGIAGAGMGLGGGGSADDLGGLGTKGRGGGASGYGSGSGHFGTKSEGSIRQIVGDPIILGSLDRSLIDKVIKRHMNQIRYAYVRELQKDPTLAGKVVMKIVIGQDGRVASATVKSSTLGSAAAEEAIRQIFLRMVFPAPQGGGVVMVSYPLIFAPG